MKNRMILFSLLLLTLVARSAAAAESSYAVPPPYDHRGVSILSRGVRLDWTGKLWIKLVVANHTGKVLTVDRNQIDARLPDGTIKPREVSVWAGRGKAYVIDRALSHDLQIEYKIGDKPIRVALVMNGFSVDGVALKLPDLIVEPAPPPRYIAVKKDHIELKQKVHFATDRAVIMSDSFDMLDEVSDALKQRPEMRVRIEGHTDGRGTEDHNLRLSQSRADAVRSYLAQKGVKSDKLEAKGFGASRPRADDATPDGQEQNRRVEFQILAQ